MEETQRARRQFLWSRKQFLLNNIAMVALTALILYFLPSLWPAEYKMFLEQNWQWAQLACGYFVGGQCSHRILFVLAHDYTLIVMLAFEVFIAMFVARLTIYPGVIFLMEYSPRYSSLSLFVLTLAMSFMTAAMLYMLPEWAELAGFMRTWKYPVFLTFLFLQILELFLRQPVDEFRCVVGFIGTLIVSIIGWTTIRLPGSTEQVVVLFTIPTTVLVIFQLIWILRLYGGKQLREETQGH